MGNLKRKGPQIKKIKFINNLLFCAVTFTNKIVRKPPTKQKKVKYIIKKNFKKSLHPLTKKRKRGEQQILFRKRKFNKSRAKQTVYWAAEATSSTQYEQSGSNLQTCGASANVYQYTWKYNLFVYEQRGILTLCNGQRRIDEERTLSWVLRKKND